MNRLLLDTHAFLWWLSDSPKLKRAARDAIAAPSALVHVSAATIWEISIKARLGKVNPGTKHIDREIAVNQFSELGIFARHALAAGNLPLHHEDPFDRMLIAQAQLENLTIVTHDEAFRPYKVGILWT
ncbi:MAG: type II toxin-antitoxin system VapC family toxin [Acidobacteria bacterium]|nr:type II toxin-antitoxin system VapC family toxin [Acidobacteriota bacterium]